MIKQRAYRRSATPDEPGPTPAPTAPTCEPTPDKTTDKGIAKGVELAEQIGHKLKSMFEGVVAEPVPERFRALLEDLERKSGS
jgi:Anti-sigma factor NepR